MDLGFRDQGFSFASAIESDKNALETYRSNFDDVARLETITNSTKIEKDLDFLVAGPPCQGFSTAGGSNSKDPRNSLLTTSCKIAVASTPETVVIENVAGLTNRVNIAILDEAISILCNSGYFVDKRILNCENYGVAQRRRRLFIVARKGNRPFSLAHLKQQPKINIREALKGIKEDDNWHQPKKLKSSSKEWLIASAIQQGQKLCNVRASKACVHTWNIPKAFGLTEKAERECLHAIQKLRRQIRRRPIGDADPVTLDAIQSVCGTESVELVESLLKKGFLREIDNYYDLTNTFNGKYRRLVWEGLSPTVDTRFGDFRMFLHPLENRGMTIREAARIQGFPDTFKFPLKTAQAYRQIGNAVPPPVAASLAGTVRELLQ